jgi:putative acetyltransferase
MSQKTGDHESRGAGGFPDREARAKKSESPAWRTCGETMPSIALESPLTPDLALLFARHEADMHADTPPESIHMLDRAALEAPGIWFFVMREEGEPVAMGAFKRIGPDHAEIKSMHVLAEARGRGLSRRMLEHLIDAARAEGFSRLSLETGVQPTFVAARALYANAGFEDCPPFEGYRDDPNSVFMTKMLA